MQKEQLASSATSPSRYSSGTLALHSETQSQTFAKAWPCSRLRTRRFMALSLWASTGYLVSLQPSIYCQLIEDDYLGTRLWCMPCCLWCFIRSCQSLPTSTSCGRSLDIQAWCRTSSGKQSTWLPLLMPSLEALNHQSNSSFKHG